MGAYQAMLGDGGQAPDEKRAAFRRSDGRVLLLAPGVAQLLSVFAEPTTLATAARSRLWMLDEATANRTWDLLIRFGAIRRVAADEADEADEADDTVAVREAAPVPAEAVAR